MRIIAVIDHENIFSLWPYLWHCKSTCCYYMGTGIVMITFHNVHHNEYVLVEIKDKCRLH